jgi:hypothetical protein
VDSSDAGEEGGGDVEGDDDDTVDNDSMSFTDAVTSIGSRHPRGQESVESLPSTPAAMAAVRESFEPTADFGPLLTEFGLDSFEPVLRAEAGGVTTTRELLLRVPEARMSALGIPLVKARKLVDRLRSVEADALGATVGMSALGFGRRPTAVRLLLEPLLAELDLGDYRDAIVATAGGSEVADLLRLSEVELVERAKMPKALARKLRRRAYQHHQFHATPEHAAPGSGGALRSSSSRNLTSVGRALFDAPPSPQRTPARGAAATPWEGAPPTQVTPMSRKRSATFGSGDEVKVP